jgi:hypothetical protein
LQSGPFFSLLDILHETTGLLLGLGEVIEQRAAIF